MVLTLPPALAWEQGPEGEPVASDPASAKLDLVPVGDGWDLSVSVDPTWLEGKSFPVVLDPTLLYSANYGDGPTLEGYAIRKTGGCAGSCLLTRDAYLFAGSWDTNNPVRYVRYDLSDIPEDARIDSTSFRIYNTSCMVIRTPDPCASKNHFIGLHRMNANWYSWSDYDDLAAVTASSPFTPWLKRSAGAAPGNHYWDDGLTDQVQRWVNRSDPNYGFAIRSLDETPDEAGPAYLSSRTSTTSRRPLLSVSYTVVPPNSPEVAAFAGNGAARVHWGIPNSGGAPITSYLIKTYRSGAYVSSKTVTCPCPNVAAVEGLTNGSNYHFTVQARNSVGYSTAATSASVIPSAAFPTAPSPASASPGNASAAASWRHPSTGAADVDAYVVQVYDPEIGYIGEVVRICPCATTLGLGGLVNGKTYILGVYAYNDAGYSVPSITGVVTPSSTRPGTPREATVTQTSAGAVQVSWLAPTTGTSPTGYTLVPYDSLTGEVTGASESITCPCSSLNATLDGLATGRTYLIAVRASNSAGLGSPTISPAVIILDVTNDVVPTVTSSSHPDQARAYDDNDPSLSWSADDPSGIAGWPYVLDQQEATVPDTTSEGTATTTSYSDLSDGNWGSTSPRSTAPATGARRRTTASPSTPRPCPPRWCPRPPIPTPSAGTPMTPPPWSGPTPTPLVRSPTAWVFDQDPSTTPDEVSEGEAASVGFPATADGAWWFHVRSQVPNGRWSDTAHHRVNIDTTVPGAPGNPRSTSHLRGVSSPDRTVDMSWAAAPDEGSGVSGYRWSFTDSESPPSSPEAETTTPLTSASSEELADGVWFFHARALDAAGNLGPYASFGPVVIDEAAGLILPRLGLDPTAASDGLGLEQFHPYDSTDLGAATAYTNLDNGNLVVVDDDEDIPAQGLNVGVRHVYNSQRGTADDGLGRGWNLSVGDFSAGLEGLTGTIGDLDLTRPLALADLGDVIDGVYQVLGQVLEFSDADGTTHRFVRRGGPGARWESPPGVDLRVVEQRGLLGLVSAYDLVRPDGVTYRAENISLLPGIDLPSPTWRLTRVFDRNGNRLDYSYGRYGLTQAVRLAEVTHNRRPGVMVALSYDGNANLDTVETLPGLEAIDPATGEVRSWARAIDFDVEADLGGVLGASRLMEVVENAHLPEGDPARRTTSYTYDDDGLLAGVVAPGAPRQPSSATSPAPTRHPGSASSTTAGPRTGSGATDLLLQTARTRPRR